MKTPKGHYVIFNITEFLPGRSIPSCFCDEVERSNGGTWFFQPSDWTQENHWGGSWLSALAPNPEDTYPMVYSTAFQSAEEALTAATHWEETEEARERQRIASWSALW